MTESSRFRWRESAKEMPSAELLRECGQRLTDRSLWQEFQKRFHRNITIYVMRTMWMRHGRNDTDLVCDLAQDVYLRLLQNNGRLLCSFRGNTEFSVLAFLGRTTMSVVSDHYRSQQAGKRQSGEVISIERSRNERITSDDMDFSAVLSWIDVERLMESDSDRRNAARNVLIFKLHYVDGFTASEISQFPAFGLTESAIEVILKNLRLRLKKKMGR